MKKEDFEIGEEFFASAGLSFKCTDKGTRTITAIATNVSAKALLDGPPFMVREEVFDEERMKHCFKKQDSDLVEHLRQIADSAHPGLESAVIKKILKDRANSDKYKNKDIFRFSRVGVNGGLLQPYGAIKEKDGWKIQSYDILNKETLEMPEEDFISLKLSDNDDIVRVAALLKNRKNKKTI